MRKSEMTRVQMQTRDTIINTLINAGWDCDIAIEQLFVLNHQMPCEASMFYQNNDLKVIVDYFAEKGLLYFCIHKRLANRINIAIKFDSCLKDLLELFISFQNEITLSNYIDQVKKIIAVCPNAFLDREGKFIPLT